MAPNGEASSAVVAAVAPFLATFIGNHHLGHGGDGHGHKEMELLATTTGGGGGGGGESIPAEEQQQVVEEAECECCGMSEECTAAYAGAVRRRFSGRWVCGLCAEAVAEEAGKKKGGEREAALAAHMAVCRRFNGFGRTHPALFQADAMRHILRKLSAPAPLDRPSRPTLAADT